MAAVTVVKFFLTIYCRRFANEIIRAYAQDHFFDVITNSIGLATALLAIKFYWWLDPLGAILVSWPHTEFVYVSSHETYFHTNNIYVCIYIFYIDSIVHYQQLVEDGDGKCMVANREDSPTRLLGQANISSMESSRGNQTYRYSESIYLWMQLFCGGGHSVAWGNVSKSSA